MVKRARLPQTDRHIFLYDEDLQFLSNWFGARAPNPANRLGVSAAVREIVHKHVGELRSRMNAAVDQAASPPVQEPVNAE